jgi:membrane protein implicated in regulation of membrane protease activity
VLQKLGFLLIGGGVLVALGFFLKWFFATSLIALGFRIAIAVIIVGILLLLATAGWERYRAAKGKEKEFKEVKY